MDKPEPIPADPPRAALDPPTLSTNGWGLPLALLAGLAIASALLLKFKPPAAPAGDAAVAEGWTPAAAHVGGSVSLSIDFGNGASRELAGIPWREGMTAGDVMRAASTHRPGIRMTSQGDGAMTLLTSIDGVANHRAGGRAWIYKVNDRAGEASFAVQRLNAGDRVAWEFTAIE